MSDISMFSWQNNVFNDLLKEINWNTNIIILKGSSGIGKTYIAKEIQNHYINKSNRTNERKCIYFIGNDTVSAKLNCPLVAQ